MSLIDQLLLSFVIIGALSVPLAFWASSDERKVTKALSDWLKRQ